MAVKEKSCRPGATLKELTGLEWYKDMKATWTSGVLATGYISESCK